MMASSLRLPFRQEYPPGWQALSDFTDAAELAVKVAGMALPHVLYHFWLAFSGWQSVKAVQGGESFTAVTEGPGGTLAAGGCAADAPHRSAFGGVAQFGD
jgi:hypothetical protein